MSHKEVEIIRPKSRGLSIVLALFLGFIGAHKYYHGKYFQGLAYTMFFWTFIPGIIAFVEALIYIAIDDKEWRANYFSKEVLTCNTTTDTAGW